MISNIFHDRQQELGGDSIDALTLTLMEGPLVAYTIQITKDDFVYLEKAAIRGNAVVLPQQLSISFDRREKKRLNEK